MYSMSKFIKLGLASPGTLVQNLAHKGVNPLRSMFYKSSQFPPSSDSPDGVTDSVKYFLHDGYLPGSEEHELLKSLTKSF